MPRENAGPAAAATTSSKSNGAQGAQSQSTAASPPAKGLFQRLGVPQAIIQEVSGRDAEPGQGSPDNNGAANDEEEFPGENNPHVPAEGEPTEGDPGEGDPGDGDPNEGEPGEGDPGDGDPGEEGDPGDGEHEHAENIRDLPEPVQRKINQRIGKLTRRATKAETERDELLGQVTELREALEQGGQPVVAPTPNDPLANVRDPRGLQAVVSEARAMREWCRAHRNGVTTDEGTENEKVISADQVQTWLDTAEDILSEHAPRKAQQLQANAHFDSLARQIHPEVFKRDSKEFQLARALIAEIPGLATHPARNLLIGDYLEGVRSRTARTAKANGNGNGRSGAANLTGRVIPPLAPRTAKPPSGLPASQNGSKRVEDAMDNVVKDGGSVESLVGALKAMRATPATADRKRPVTV